MLNNIPMLLRSVSEIKLLLCSGGFGPCKSKDILCDCEVCDRSSFATFVEGLSFEILSRSVDSALNSNVWLIFTLRAAEKEPDLLFWMTSLSRRSDIFM